MKITNESKGRLEETILAICSEWLLVVDINMQEDTYTTIHNNMAEYGLQFPTDGCYSELNVQIQDLISADYRKKRTQFCSLESLKRNLMDCQRTECEYVVSTGSNNWRRDIFQVIERDGDMPLRIVWVHVDIEQKKSEELKQRELVQGAHMLSEQAYAIKNMYLDRISKELQAPMNVIIGNAAIARAFSTDSDRVEECLANIFQSAKTMFQMVNQLVKMDAIEEGHVVMRMQNVSIIEAWRKALDMLMPTLRMHHHTLNTDSVFVKHSYVRGDEDIIRQIILNLLQNAISFTPVGGQIRVSVRETQLDENYGQYELCVEDNGVGMTDEFRKIMFEPFAREHSMQVGHVQGLGLGLVIVHNLVRLLDGEIRVDSTRGKGTKVTVSIKLAYAPPNTKLSGNRSGDTPSIKSDYVGKRVLLVEDNTLVADVERKILVSMGMEVEHALNGEDAVRMFEDSEEGYYDLILMDLGLPGIDGYVATMGIRQTNRQDAQSVPVIAMTGRSSPERLNIGYQEHLFHVQNPLDAQELMQVLRKIFNE